MSALCCTHRHRPSPHLVLGVSLLLPLLLDLLLPLLLDREELLLRLLLRVGLRLRLRPLLLRALLRDLRRSRLRERPERCRRLRRLRRLPDSPFRRCECCGLGLPLRRPRPCWSRWLALLRRSEFLASWPVRSGEARMSLLASQNSLLGFLKT